MVCADLDLKEKRRVALEYSYHAEENPKPQCEVDSDLV
jgi:hypothetical protein